MYFRRKHTPRTAAFARISFEDTGTAGLTLTGSAFFEVTFLSFLSVFAMTDFSGGQTLLVVLIRAVDRKFLSRLQHVTS